MYLTNLVVAGENRNLAYVIALPEDAEAGKPGSVVEGVAIPGAGETIIDDGVARKRGVEIGDEGTVPGREFTVAGVSAGNSSMINSVAFVSMADFIRLSGTPDTVSYVLARIEPDESPGKVAQRIEADIGGVTAQSREEFAGQERNIVTDMTTELVALMNLVGLLIGLAVVALTVYIATLSRRDEYGVLKALGARNRHLYGVVLAQALYSTVLGFAVGLAFTLLLSAAAPFLALNLSLAVSGASLVKVGGMALVNDTSLILADEPTANLDSSIGHEVMRLPRHIAREQERSVIIVSHDARIRDTADRSLWLEDGEFKDMVSMATDPVCGMTVEREKSVSAEHEGQTYYFCARGCRDEFLETGEPAS